ncbi:hypothetical protein F441_03729 [Phytophthora nicotianae CJ01A1]|uniref:Uncharacterized protein n=1 Tax=Phytophthora nicotianae CJ01A1 TaxID=1317063 RepID=W2XJL6_PHYNI|nr:hypothetical protein F441_03729 [Phytophthora nicotianae CJ01A1]
MVLGSSLFLRRLIREWQIVQSRQRALAFKAMLCLRTCFLWLVTKRKLHIMGYHRGSCRGWKVVASLAALLAIDYRWSSLLANVLSSGIVCVQTAGRRHGGGSVCCT